MEAIVSLLDAEHSQRVAALQDELQQRFGVKRVREIVPYPHVTYQGVESYDRARVRTILQTAAQHMQPFTIQTDGLGIFTGSQPVLFISVVRSIALSAYHQTLWETIGAARVNYSPLYRHDGPWMPHITLAQWDIDVHNLPEIIRLLCERPLSWEVTLDNLALFIEGADGRYSCERFPFGMAGKG